MQDIRIEVIYNVQPVLFGPPQVYETYRLMDWDTDLPINTIIHKSMPEAQTAMVEYLRPQVRAMALQYTERDGEE